VFMCAKVNCNSWKGLKFVDNIVHPTRACIHSKKIITQNLHATIQTKGPSAN
jgi:hypothetical protein